ncbi:MAG: hypothetical protein B5M53_04985 [Candidatus Cloacimonas sp. 4484_209]|nr:hypothetical protein [Candidatus Calescamantes bacterium]OQX54959.1 MAG: hypothetical protein B5M53_04985 [Candidatus Cloacimonas sp. 4484_209]
MKVKVCKCVLMVIVIVLLGCNIDFLPDVEPPEHNNPYDPNNPNPQELKTEIIEGPEEGAVVDTCYVRFVVRANRPSSQYVAAIDDTINKSSWNRDSVYEYCLCEGEHVFYVKSKDALGNVEKVWVNRTFVVNDVDGPGVIFYPFYISHADSGSSFTTHIYLDDVDSLKGFSIKFTYPSNRFSISAIKLDSSFLLSNNPDGLASFIGYNNTWGRCSLDVYILGGDPEWVSGSGSIATITFSVSIVARDSITFSHLTLSKGLNSNISVKYHRNCIYE